MGNTNTLHKNTYIFMYPNRYRQATRITDYNKFTDR